MKCSVCGKGLEETFMKKVLGGYVRKEGSSKLYPLCPECQGKFTTKEELLKHIK